MKKNLLAIALFASLAGSSQTMLQKWYTVSNNAAITNSDDRPYYTDVDATGMIAIAGMSNSKGIVAAYDPNGNDLWTNKYSTYTSDTPLGLFSDNSGNYYVAYFWGGTVRKINSSGITQWTGNSGNSYHGHAFIADTSGKSYVAGTDYAQTTVYLDKFGSGGSVTASQTYTGFYGLGGRPVKMKFDNNGNLLLAMVSKDASGNNYPSLAKFDNQLNFVWHQAYTALTGEVNDLFVDPSNNTNYITGYVSNGGNGYDALTMKVGSAGALSWSATFHDAALNSDDFGNSITKDNSGNYYVGIYSSGSSKKYTIRKFTSAGAILASNSTPTTFYSAVQAKQKLKYNSVNNRIYMSTTDNAGGYDNYPQLYKTDQSLASITSIYQWNHDVTQDDFSVDLTVVPGSGSLVITANVFDYPNGNDYAFVRTDTVGNFEFGGTYNGLANGEDQVASIKTDNNNDAIVAGTTNSTLTSYDGYLIKYDQYGNEQWQSVFNGPDSLDDRFAALDTSASGVIYAGGYVSRKISSFSSHKNMWLMKVDQNGTKLWEIMPTGTLANSDDEIVDLFTDNSNNVYSVGYQSNSGTGKDAVIFKTNSSGTVIWTKKYTGPGSGTDAFLDVVEKGTANIYAAGYTTKSNGNKDLLLAKYDNNGNLLWTYIWDSPQGGNDTALSAGVDVNGNVYVVGHSDSAKVVTIKLTSSGALKWVKTEPYPEVGPSIAGFSSGHVMIVCRRDTGFASMMRVVCYDSMGVNLWNREYYYSCCEHPMKIRKTSRLTGLFLMDFYSVFGVIELDTLGNELNNVLVSPGAVNESGGARAITLDKNGDIYAAGYFPDFSMNHDIHVMKLCYTPAPVAVTGNDSICMGANGQLYSAPANTSVTGYNWSLPAGAGIVSGSGTNSVTVNFGTANTGGIYLEETNYCGTSSVGYLLVNVLPLPAVSAGQDLTVCPGSVVTLSGAGAQTYSWNNGVNNNIPFTASVSQFYAVSGTDSLGCANSDTVMVSMKTPPTVNICMVTVDSASTHNILLWDKTSLDDVSYFNIYREDITNNYTLIGAVAYDSLSEYHDYGADPNITTKRYKIAAMDTCGNEGPKSDFHNTIYVGNNNGTFTWNTYTIQNQSNPVQFYALYRDTISNGNWEQVGTTAGTQNVLSDPNYGSYPNGSWRIETIWNISCDPTRAVINTSRSNIKSQAVGGPTTGMSEIQTTGVSFAPNPFNQSSQIEIRSNSGKIDFVFELYDETGRLVRSEKIMNPKFTLERAELANGIYFYKLRDRNNGQTLQGKIIIGE
jgi:hypothetical protein